MLETSDSSTDGLSGRRLKEAVKYVSRTWLPVNVTVLRQIQLRLAEGFYADKRETLIDDIKGDVSLLAFCFRKMDGVVSSSQTSTNPINILRKLEIEQLKAILSTSEEEISAHRLDDIRDIQALRIRHSLISCGTAEMLARTTAMDPDTAFSIAMMRQLGFMLVAWNYPSSFQQAITAVVSSGNDIETELAKILGFDPRLLGYEVALHWNHSAELRQVLGWPAAVNIPNSGPVDRAGVQAMSKYCYFGEALARVSNKEHYPKAVQEWKEVEGEVNKLLGGHGLKELNDHLRVLCNSYASFKPELFNRDVSPEGNVRKANAELIARLLEENAYAKRCPEDMQREFKKVYDRICYGEVSTDGLNYMVTKLIPKAGFVRGCVFLLDPRTATLIPRVRIGDVSSRFYKPVVCSAAGDRSNPIAEAYHCNTPIKQEGAFLHNDIVSHVSGRFGKDDKGGVLHLEMSDLLCQQENHVPILYFKAIRACLDHCLNFFNK